MTSPRPTAASLRAARAWVEYHVDSLALLLDARHAEVEGLLRECQVDSDAIVREFSAWAGAHSDKWGIDIDLEREDPSHDGSGWACGETRLLFAAWTKAAELAREELGDHVEDIHRTGDESFAKLLACAREAGREAGRWEERERIFKAVGRIGNIELTEESIDELCAKVMEAIRAGSGE